MADRGSSSSRTGQRPRNWQIHRRASVDANKIREEMTLGPLYSKPVSELQARESLRHKQPQTALVDRADDAQFNGMFSVQSKYHVARADSSMEVRLRPAPLFDCRWCQGLHAYCMLGW